MRQLQQNTDDIIDPSALYWAQPQLAKIVAPEKIRVLQHLEVFSFLSDLYWGEWLASQLARIRFDMEPTARQSVRKRICFDEIRHFALVSQYLVDRGILPLAPSPLFKNLQQKLDMLDQSRDEQALVYARKIQAYLEELVAKVIEWRLPAAKDQKLYGVLEIIQRDEIYHIHASLHDLQKDKQPPIERSVLLATFSHSHFPLHLARGVLSLQEFRQVRKIAPDIAKNCLVSKPQFQRGVV